MSKRINAKFKSSRRLGVNLWGTAKNPLTVKNYPPGLHGTTGGRKILSSYGKQLAEKQKLRKHYGDITEKQFRRTFKIAENKKGDTGENLVGLLESRLDVAIYRANFTPTIFAARQYVSHKHFKVNGQTVNIASYRLKEGDIVEVRDKSKKNDFILESIQRGDREAPEYLDVDNDKLSFKVVRIPKQEEVPYPMDIELNLIIEYYSQN